MSLSPIEAPETGDGSALCVACGLCCNGALFSRLRASPDELDRLGGQGEQLGADEANLYAPLPCAHHCAAGCGAYEIRYRTCRSFRCRLLRKLEAGEIGAAEAQRTVGLAKERIAAAAGAGAATHRQRAALRAAWQEGDAETRRRLARDYVDAIALDRFLDETFRARKDGSAAGVLSWE